MSIQQKRRLMRQLKKIKPFIKMIIRPRRSEENDDRYPDVNIHCSMLISFNLSSNKTQRNFKRKKKKKKKIALLNLCVCVWLCKTHKRIKWWLTDTNRWRKDSNYSMRFLFFSYQEENRKVKPRNLFRKNDQYKTKLKKLVKESELTEVWRYNFAMSSSLSLTTKKTELGETVFWINQFVELVEWNESVLC